jgi:integration host factor subunit beta
LQAGSPLTPVKILNNIELLGRGSVTMTKSQLVESVAQKTNITKSRAESVVNCIFDTMVSALEHNEGIEIRGFGSFTIREYRPYDGRNPRTGKAVSVPKKRLPFFKVGKGLKALVNREPESAEDDSTEE